MSRVIIALVTVITLAAAAPLAAQAVRCTTQDVGTVSYTNCSNGTRVETQRIGQQTYSTASDGTRASTQQIGPFTSYRDSRGNIGSTQGLGAFTYTTITGPNGTVRGSSQRIGTTTYGSYRVTEPVAAPLWSSVPSVPVLPPLPW